MIMNVLFIVSSLSSFGGTERSVINLINILLSKQFNVTVYCIHNSNITYEINGKIIIKSLGLSKIPNNILRKFPWFYRLFLKLKYILRDNNFTHIISVGHNISFLVPLSINKYCKAKIIAWEHINYKIIPKISRFFMSFTYRKFSNIVVLTDYQKDLLSAHYKNIVVIPNSLPFQSAEIATLDSNNIIMVGRLSPEKGYDRVFDIAKYIKNKHPNWEIHIYGDGILRDSLIRKKDELGLGNNLYFEKPTNNIREKYLNSSIFMLTSYTEVMPMVLLEAMSFGLPVIAYNDEGIGYFIKNDYNGYQIKSNDVISFCDKITLLINDIEKRRILGKNAKIYSSQFAAERIAQYWTNLLE